MLFPIGAQVDTSNIHDGTFMNIQLMNSKSQESIGNMKDGSPRLSPREPSKDRNNININIDVSNIMNPAFLQFGILFIGLII